MANISGVLADTVYAYTGLSLSAFFTILALMAAVFYIVSSMFVSPAEEEAAKAEAARRAMPPPEAFLPPPKPVKIGDITAEELTEYNGKEATKPICIAIRGKVYDVTAGRLFYGPGGPYSFLAGREASRALALMSFDRNDLNDNLEDLSTDEMEVLQDWEEKFKEKYVEVGQVVSKEKKGDRRNNDNEVTEKSSSGSDKYEKIDSDTNGNDEKTEEDNISK